MRRLLAMAVFAGVCLTPSAAAAQQADDAPDAIAPDAVRVGVIFEALEADRTRATVRMMTPSGEAADWTIEADSVTVRTTENGLTLSADGSAMLTSHLVPGGRGGEEARGRVELFISDMLRDGRPVFRVTRVVADQAE